MAKPKKSTQHPYGADELPLAVIVDIDGTVAHVTDRKPWDWKDVSNDLPNQPIIDYVRQMASFGARIIYITGRSETCRAQTLDWLEQHVGVPHELLLMRPSSKGRMRDADMKWMHYRKYVDGVYNVHSVLEDRQRVVDMWRDRGLTVLQVAPGGF